MTILIENLSIVIPVYNREDCIADCLRSVLHQSINNYEVIVIDDASTDNTVSIVQSFIDKRIRLICNKTKQGLSFSRNRGARHAKGQIIAFTDSDCEVVHNWLRELVKPFIVDESIMITGGRIIDPSPKTYWEKVNNGLNFIDYKSGYVLEIVGCNMAINREFLVDNTFDEHLLASEEGDLCIRCVRQNKKIYYTNQALVTHYHRSSLKSSMSQHFRYGCFNATVLFKHKVFPFSNCGVLFFIVMGMCFLLGVREIGLYCLIYFCLIGYRNCRRGARSWLEWLVTYPGFAIVLTAFYLGYLFSPIIWLKTIFFYLKRHNESYN